MLSSSTSLWLLVAGVIALSVMGIEVLCSGGIVNRMCLMKGFLSLYGYPGGSGMAFRRLCILFFLAIEGFVGISPKGVWSCHAGKGKAEVFPGVSFGIVMLECRRLFFTGRLYPFKLL